jgi:hypothetical protein
MFHVDGVEIIVIPKNVLELTQLAAVRGNGLGNPLGELR